MGKPHKCPKCNGTGWLPYNPQAPYMTESTSTQPQWHCDVCVSGIIWEQAILNRSDEDV